MGLIILFAALYPVFIQTDIPYATIVLVILFNGLGNVVNYFFHGKYLILLKADGKNYIRAGLEIFTNTFKQISKIILISIGYDVVAVQFTAMMASLVQMIYISYYIQKHYSWIDLSVRPDLASISQSKHVFVHEINYMISANIDTILLTFFSTLKVVSVYSLYALLYSIIERTLRSVKEAFEFKLANEYYRNREVFLKFFEAYETYYITIAFALLTIINIFISPFLKIYTYGITDANYIDPYLPYLFTFIHLLSSGRYPSDAMVHIAGHFQQTKKSATIETLINLIMSVILVRVAGIYGVLAGTAICSMYRTNYLIFYANKKIVLRKAFKTYKCWGVNFGIYVLIMCLSHKSTISATSYFQLLAVFIPYSLGVISIYLTVISISKPQSFRYIVSLLRKSKTS